MKYALCLLRVTSLRSSHTQLGHLTTSDGTSILCRCGHKNTILEELSLIKLSAAIYCESVGEDSLVSIASRHLTKLKEIKWFMLGEKILKLKVLTKIRFKSCCRKTICVMQQQQQ